MKTTLPLDSLPHEQWVRIPFPVPAYLTLRAAGDLRPDSEARGEFYRSVGIDPQAVHVVGQVHSKEVAVVPGAAEQSAGGEHFTPDADGMITSDPDAILGITVADCMPIFLYDKASGARGVLHSGWRGTGILGTAIGLLRDEFGALASDLVVTMGPCISAESYEVDKSRATSFAAEWGRDSVRMTDGGHYLDLRAANQEICRCSGVDLINVIDHCTVRDSRLGSYRRDGPEKYTLMLALLGGTHHFGDT